MNSSSEQKCMHWLETKAQPGAPGSSWQECKMCGKTLKQILETGRQELLKRIEGELPEKYDLTLPVTDEVFYKSTALKMVNETIESVQSIINAIRESI